MITDRDRYSDFSPPPSFYDKAFSWKRPRDLELSPGLRLRRRQIGRHVKLDLAGTRILEVGSGSAPQSLVFSSSNRVFADISFDQMLILQNQGYPCVVAHGDALPFAPESFDLVICTDVIEHIENDEHCLKEIRHTLKDGGWLVLSVPHRMDYYGGADIEAGHFRRYEVAALREKLSDGFTVESLFPIWGKRWNRIENFLTKLHMISPSLKIYAKTPFFAMRPLSLFLYLLMKIDLRLTELREASSIGLLCKKGPVNQW
jgi:SAM-dependent methyltransferase